jgi:methylglutaconyl-CoA hydratase
MRHCRRGNVAYETITLDISPRAVATVTLNRPDRGNALNQTLIDDMGVCMTALAADPAVRVVVLRGAGKHFCAGADLGGPGQSAGPPKFTLAGMMETVDRCPKPTIAAVHGAAIGGGFALTSACDVILATPEAFFAIPETRLGMAPSPTLSALFMRAVGYRAFRRYGFSGERINAALAHEFGHVSEICAAADLDARVAEVVDAMLMSAPAATAELKARVAEYGVPPASKLYDPIQRDAKHVRTEEAHEGVAAFREKRKPKWYPQ